MKKIISLCLVVLVFALVVTVFTACGDNTEDGTTTTEASEIVNGEFSVNIEATQAVVKKGDKEFQTLLFPINPNIEFDLKYAKENHDFIDMNFDGNPDFYIAVNSKNGVVDYYCWLYNATTNQFDYSAILSALKNISIDADNHRVLSSVVVDGEKHVFSYKWVDGQLLLDSDFSENNGGIPEDVTQVLNDNAIGVEKPTSSDSKEETTKKNASSGDNKTTTKVNKPANTTTTAPNKTNTIILETGNENAGWY